MTKDEYISELEAQLAESMAQTDKVIAIAERLQKEVNEYRLLVIELKSKIVNLPV